MYRMVSLRTVATSPASPLHLVLIGLLSLSLHHARADGAPAPQGAALWSDATTPVLGDAGPGRGVALGDVDGDGDLDIYLVNLAAANRLYLNQGGTFVDGTSGPLGDTGFGTSAAFGDLDNDGDLDLYLVNGGSDPLLSTNRLFRNEGGGAFVDVTSGPLGDTGDGTAVAIGDVDNDGDLDLYLVRQSLQANKLLRNEGAGVFVDATAGPLGNGGSGHNQRAAFADVDGDGDLDLYLSSFGPNRYFRNEGAGAFVDATAGPLGDAGNGVGIAFGDVDNDGDLDLYLSNFNSANKLFRNEGGGVFVDVTTGPLGDAGAGTDVAFEDVDNDGDLDLYLVRTSGQANKLFRNEGGGVFVDATVAPLDDAGDGLGVAMGDVDGDGDIDLYLSNSGQANKLIKADQAAAGNSWLHARLLGTRSNRSAIGARVRVVAGGVSQIREIPGGSGSQGSLIAEFGLGGAASVDSIVVRWPTGDVQRRAALAVSQLLEIQEEGRWVNSTPLDLANSGSNLGLAFGDIEGDGDLDLYVVNDGEPNRMFRNDGGSFVDVTGGPVGDAGRGFGAVFGDTDNDGDLDLYLVNADGPNRLFRNEGDGTFVDGTTGPLGDAGSGLRAAFGDVDDDGDLDLYLANAAIDGGRLLRNEGGGVFVNATTGPLGGGIAREGVTFADVDNDGDLDLYLTSCGGPNRLLRNEGNGVFADATAGPLGSGGGLAPAFGDVDNDGDLDLFLGSCGGASQLLRNEGAGAFVDVTSGALSESVNGRAAAMGDVDGDGDLDICVANVFGPTKLFVNDKVAFGNHWLHLNLVGTETDNRSAVGARVRLVAGGQGQMREVAAGEGVRSQNSLTVEFGLGASTRVDSIVVRWPSGVIQHLPQVPANQVLTVARRGVYNGRINKLYSTIQSAIAEALPGDTLVAQTAAYNESVDFLGKAITLRSLDPGNPDVVASTFIVGSGLGASAVRFVNSEGPGSVLDGFTIIGGEGELVSGVLSGGGMRVSNSSPTIRNCRFYSDSARFGGAIRIGPGSNPLIVDCRFDGNRAKDNGGAVYIDAGSAPQMTRCRFDLNGASFGGAVYLLSASAVFSECVFSGNVAGVRGGAVFASGVSPDLRDCRFVENVAGQGGAIACFQSGVVSIADMVFTGNRAGDGGAIYGDRTRYRISGCDFEGNAADQGAAVFVSGDSSEVRNCRFFGNSAPKPGAGGGGSGSVTAKAPGGFEPTAITVFQCLFSGNHGVAVVADGPEVVMTVRRSTFFKNGGGVLANGTSQIDLRHCILWGDALPEIRETFDGSVTWSYCDVDGTAGRGGQGFNLDSSPSFRDPGGPDNVVGTPDDDLRLTLRRLPGPTGRPSRFWFNPCRDVGGDSPDPSNPEFDLAGVPRFLGKIDIGAYEYADDCDSSGVADIIEIQSGLLADCNGNLVFDDCETWVDCDQDGVFDACQIAANQSLDANGNQVLDVCEATAFISGEVWDSTSTPVVVVTGLSLVTGDLTIEAGVKVAFTRGAALQVTGSAASLIVNGTAEHPVLFTPTAVAPAPGYWGPLRILAGSSAVMNHAVVEYSGYVDPAQTDSASPPAYGIQIADADVTLRDCVVHEVAGVDRPRHGLEDSTVTLAAGPASGIHATGTSNVVIVRTRVEEIRGGEGAWGASGDPGAAGASGQDGRPGQPGQAGQNGTRGYHGTEGGDAMGIYCGPGTDATIVSCMVRNVQGGPGGAGGCGGMGGVGGDGGHGLSWNLLTNPPIFKGANGGNGGSGGYGGPGGKGARGGDAFGILLDEIAAARVHQNLVANVSGGEGGKGGPSGSRGPHGNGGKGGNSLVHYNPLEALADPTKSEGGQGGRGGGVDCGCTHPQTLGGDGGSGGVAQGISVGAAATIALDLAQNTIAALYPGPPGELGDRGVDCDKQVLFTAHREYGRGGKGGRGWFFAGEFAEFLPVFLPCFRELDRGACKPDSCWGCGKNGDDVEILCPPQSCPPPQWVAGALGSVVGVAADGQVQLNVGNSILHSGGGSSTGVSASTPGGLSISYSILSGFETAFGENTTQGSGNLLSDPLFAAPGEGNFRLIDGSPAVDAGDDARVPPDVADLDADADVTEPIPFDLDGNPRFLDGDVNVAATVDLGAYEYGGALVDVTPPGGLPRVFALHQSLPNPFTRIATIRYELPRPARVELGIYDVTGRLVRALERSWKPAGQHAATWDGLDGDGSRVRSGLYFYRLDAGEFRHARKLVHVR